MNGIGKCTNGPPAKCPEGSSVRTDGFCHVNNPQQFVCSTSGGTYEGGKCITTPITIQLSCGDIQPLVGKNGLISFYSTQSGTCKTPAYDVAGGISSQCNARVALYGGIGDRLVNPDEHNPNDPAADHICEVNQPTKTTCQFGDLINNRCESTSDQCQPVGGVTTIVGPTGYCDFVNEQPTCAYGTLENDQCVSAPDQCPQGFNNYPEGSTAHTDSIKQCNQQVVAPLP